ncbi:MAG: ankyrin repeat domain-containing protein [Woeseiaceae bacterium]
MPKGSDKKLLRAVLEPRKQGALKQIADACAAGADPNRICPETSTSNGYVRGGSTLLTQAISDWSSKAVAKLLECGADPNLVDRNGWTPWMASTLVDESKRDRIQKSLTEYGASTDGEHIGRLARAIADGDVDQATKLTETDQDLQVLSSFRVDLVGHQISTDNPKMLEFLLQRGMTPSSTNRTNAVRFSKFEAVDVLLRYGMAPEDPEGNETPLMTAAALGDIKVVQRLVEAGADVNRSADGNSEWTASFYARKAGHTEVAEWLTARMNEELLSEQDQAMAGRNPKYRSLYEHATASEEMSTDEIVASLTQWDEKYGVTVLDAEDDRVVFSLSSLPENIDAFLDEVIAICPDASEHKGALQEELKKNRAVGLWWD